MNVIAEKRTQDWLRGMAGDGFRRCASSNQRLARTLKVDPSVTSRIGNGRPEARSVPGEFFQIVWALATGEKTTPFPLLMEAEALAEQGIMAGMSDEALVRRFWTLYREETEQEGTANNAMSDYICGGEGTLKDLARHHLEEAARERELAATCHELDRRGLDPRAER